MLKSSDLNKLFNISLDKASNILTAIIDQDVKIEVDGSEIFNIQKNITYLQQYFKKYFNENFIVASMDFKEKLCCQGQLIFPTDKITNIMNGYLNKYDGQPCFDMGLSDVDLDILKEVSNIILICIIGEIEDLTSIELKYNLPIINVFDESSFINYDIKIEYLYIIILPITFSINDMNIKGDVILEFNSDFLNEFANKIKGIEDDISEHYFPYNR